MRLEVLSVLEWSLLQVKGCNGIYVATVWAMPNSIELFMYFMTKYCHPRGWQYQQTEHLTEDLTGLVVILIQTPITPSVGFSSTCGSLHLLCKGALPSSNGCGQT